MYYNTTNLTDEMLERAKKLTSEQDKVIFGIFSDNVGREYTSHEIEDILERFPRSSIVRSINTLTNQGLLIKTTNKVMGKYGRLVYTWKLNQAPKGQMRLF